MNRVTQCIAELEMVIKTKNFPQSQLDTLNKQMDMNIKEYVQFQELKSAYVGSAITLDEAQTIYAYLGNTPEHFNAQSLPVKIALIEQWSNILLYSMKQKKKS